MIANLPKIPFGAVYFDSTGTVLASWDGEGLAHSLLIEFAQRLLPKLDFDQAQFIWLALSGHQACVMIRDGRGLASVVRRSCNAHAFSAAMELAMCALLQEEAEALRLQEAEELEKQRALIPSPETALPIAFINELEILLGKSIGPTNARRALNAARQNHTGNWGLNELFAFLEEMRLRMPYRVRRSVFTTEVNQLLRSHGVQPLGTPRFR
jgi:hypothetical protein